MLESVHHTALSLVSLLTSTGSLVGLDLSTKAEPNEATLARCIQYRFREYNLGREETVRGCFETLSHQPPRQSADDCIKEVQQLLRSSNIEAVVKVCNALVNAQIQNSANNGED